MCNPDCLLQPGKCVAFSVGSRNQFGFENSLSPFGCTVHTFDHTVEHPNPPAHVTFHRFGLTGLGSSNPKLRSLLQLLEITQYSGGRIDLLKVDCEGCEYDAFASPEVLDFMKKHVRQLLIELHWPRRKEALIKLAEGLRSAGFLAFSKEPNIVARAGECIEYSLLNVHLVKSS